MRFAAPEWLWLLAALPVLAGAGWWFSTRRKAALLTFAGGARHYRLFASGIGPNRRILKALLLCLVALFGILAAARPQWGGKQEPVTRSGNDVLLVLDASLSMACDDLSPNRFRRAVLAAENLVRALPGDRVGLVTFSGRAVLNCPLTLDHGALSMFLDAVEIRSDLVPGTALADALKVAVDALSRDRDVGRGKTVVLFTDGEDHEAGLDGPLDSARERGIVVHAVGLGTVRGAPIPVQGKGGGISGFKTDGEGRVVTTRLDEGLLEEVTRATGGIYRRASAGGGEIRDLVEQLAGEGGELGTVLRIRYEDRYQIPLFLAFLALLAEFLIPDHGGRLSRRRNREVEA